MEWGDHDLVAIYDHGEFKGLALRCYSDRYGNTLSLNCQQFERVIDFKIHGILFETDKNGHKIKLLSTAEVEDIVETLQVRRGVSGKGDYWVISWDDIEHPESDAEYPIQGQTSISF
jgi:hypothetical protein